MIHVNGFLQTSWLAMDGTPDLLKAVLVPGFIEITIFWAYPKASESVVIASLACGLDVTSVEGACSDLASLCWLCLM